MFQYSTAHTDEQPFTYFLFQKKKMSTKACVLFVLFLLSCSCYVPSASCLLSREPRPWKEIKLRWMWLNAIWLLRSHKAGSWCQQQTSPLSGHYQMSPSQSTFSQPPITNHNPSNPHYTIPGLPMPFFDYLSVDHLTMTCYTCYLFNFFFNVCPPQNTKSVPRQNFTTASSMPRTVPGAY